MVYNIKLFKMFINRYRRGLGSSESELVHMRKRPKVHASFFFPTRPSDEYDSAPTRKYSRPFLDVFACIG